MYKDLLDRLFTHISISEKEFRDTPCWEWILSKNNGGYGHIKFNGKVLKVHRVSYEYFVGKIPLQLQIDHLCRNRCCINPLHLEAVSQKENILRGECNAAKQARMTHCKNGHLFTEDTILRDFRTNRKCCKICKRKYQKEH